MKEVPASFTSSLIPFSTASLDCLEKGGQGQKEEPSQASILSGVLKNGKLAWVCRGDALEVINTASGARIAAWKFGAFLQEERSPTITCVAEYSYEHAPKLLIGLETGVHSGMLCMFDIKTSKVVKAVDFMYKVTAVEPVTNVLSTEAPLQILSEHLRCFCGVVAVGTQYGHLYMIDMCLDDTHDDSDELLPHTLHVLTTKTRDVMRHRDEAMQRGELLALHLNEDALARGTFHYMQPDGELIESYIAEEVLVTCLKFVHPIGTLIVGFNFGCFQLWRLYNPVLDFSSKLDIDDVCPVTHFAYQEPENDPRNFCYLWVARGPLPTDTGHDIYTTVQLYQLSFQRRIWYDNYGVLYEDLLSVGVRLEHDLLTNNFNELQENVGSRLISCFTVENQRYQRPKRLESDESFEEGIHGPDLSLCLFAWEVTSTGNRAKSTCYLGLFDMNRWYHAQMPVAMRYSPAHPEQCAFFGMFSLDSVVKVTEPDDILAVNVDWATVTRFISHYVPPQELQFFPSSLAFSACCVTESGIVQTRFLGTQREALSQLVRRGPIGLVEPYESFRTCLSAGLLPSSVELGGTNLPVHAQRENLLSVALNHGITGFITSCITQFAEGEFVHAGCTLRFVLDWAWSKVAEVKDLLDKLCVPLYDCSGMPLEQQGLQLFHQRQLQLTNLQTIVQVLLTNSGPTTTQGLEDLHMKLKVVTLINQFYQAVSWCLSNSLLPEVDEAESPSSGQYSYPGSVLNHEYRTRRQQINRLHSDINETDLLMIDGMIEQEAPAVKALWSKQGGEGLYPPNSLHSLLTIYLLENIPLHTKHHLVAYFFLDLISMMGEKDQNLVERLSRFCQAVQLPQSKTRMIQGFWLLDHKDFEEAVLLLLDPMLLEEMSPWQHNRIIKAFLYQAEEKIALKFLRVKKPALVSPEDVRLHLTVLLANGLISEAFQYQKVCSDNSNNGNLLGHLFTACQQTKTIDRLLQLPLTDGEERQLLQYLRDTKETSNSEILVLHFLQRARYVEAIRLNETLRQTLMHESDRKIRERAAARNSITECYAKVLPSVQRKMTFKSDHRPKKTMHLTRREIQRPRPLSTVVHHHDNQKMVSHAMLINAVLEKIGETRQTPDQMLAKHRPRSTVDELGPFICTPVTPRAVSRLISEDTEIVYPSIQRETKKDEHLRLASPMKKTVTGILPNVTAPSPFNTQKHSINRVLSTEALSLLQTPPVKRRTPPKLKKLTSVSRTPQSILKVRQVVKRSPSPSPQQQEMPATIKKLTFLGADLTMDTPPRYQHKKVEVKKKKVKDTPKHLRFSGLSTPSPEPSPQEIKQPTPYRTRRRSPTPERTPPEQVTVSSRRPLRNSAEAEVAVTSSRMELGEDVGGEDVEEEEEDPQVQDAEVTFNFDKSRQEEAILEEETLELNEDPSPLVSSTTSTGHTSARVSFQLETKRTEQVLSTISEGSSPVDDLASGQSGEVGASIRVEALQDVEEEKMDIDDDENAESSTSQNEKDLSEESKMKGDTAGFDSQQRTMLKPLMVLLPESLPSDQQTSPVRRSPRLAHSETMEQTSEFKTPPRPSRLSPRPVSLASLPTPPESVRGSPTRSPSRQLRQRSSSRSPSKSPQRRTIEMESKTVEEKEDELPGQSRMLRKSPSRSRTPERKEGPRRGEIRSSVSPSGKTSSPSQESKQRSPARKTAQEKARKSPGRTKSKSPSRSKSPNKKVQDLTEEGTEEEEDLGRIVRGRRPLKSTGRSELQDVQKSSPQRTRGGTPSGVDTSEKDKEDLELQGRDDSPSRTLRKSPSRSRTSPSRESASPTKQEPISRRTRGSTPSRMDSPESESQTISRRTRGGTPSREDPTESGQPPISRRTRGNTPSRRESPERESKSGGGESSPERAKKSPGRRNENKQRNKSPESKSSTDPPRSPEAKPKSPGRPKKTPAKSVASKKKDRTPSPSKSPKGVPQGSRSRSAKATANDNIPTEGSSEGEETANPPPSPGRLRRSTVVSEKKSVIIETDNLRSGGSPEVVLKSPGRNRKSPARVSKTAKTKEFSTKSDEEKEAREKEVEAEEEEMNRAKSPARKARKSQARSPSGSRSTEEPREEMNKDVTAVSTGPGRRATRSSRASSVDSEAMDSNPPQQDVLIGEMPETSKVKSVKKVASKTKSLGRSPARSQSIKKRAEEEPLEFVFSEPTVIPHDLESLPESTDMPSLPFVFSPPATRTRSQKVEPLEEEEVVVFSPPGGSKVKATKKGAKKVTVKKTTKTRKTTFGSPTDSPISFLSPTTEEHSETSTQARTRVRRMASRSQSLRPKKSPVKKRRTTRATSEAKN